MPQKLPHTFGPTSSPDTRCPLARSSVSRWPSRPWKIGCEDISNRRTLPENNIKISDLKIFSRPFLASSLLILFLSTTHSKQIYIWTEPRRRVLQFSEVTAPPSCPKWLQRHNIKSHLFRAQLSFSFWRKIFLSTRAKLQMEADVFQTCLLRRFRSVCNETSCKVINVFNSFVELKVDGILATKPKSIH